ncbi:MAG TPA: bacillithiol biosynthesis cysteine-adding enzyme BshC [Bryobacteraceae bacterium]|nr:bacillithiol biosynthesis cysteine-adding enzyme BshC [Bryobacteraceae bacterium]
MENGCLRHTEIPHTSKLFSDFQYHYDRVSGFYAHAPGDLTSFRAAAREIQFPAERRAALVQALRKRNANNPSLDLLAQEGTVAVVTGQQVGLFSGPAYTIHKAVTAVRLARRLTEEGIPAVPVFWLATEDHDLAEINHAYVFDQDHRPVRLQADGHGPSLQPVGTIPMREVPIDALAAALAPFAFGEEVSSLVARAYQPGVTFGEAFLTLLQELLAPWNVLFVDPLDAEVRRIAAPLLRDALHDSTGLKDKLLARNKELAQAGYHAQVLIEPQTSLFFVLEDNRRVSLKRQNGDYASKDRTYSIGELVDRAEHVSPNALLRPVMQDYLLPTVAYVGGPAELAYMAQSQVIYEDLLGRMPVMVARSGFTILDQKAAKLMDRYHMRLPELFQSEAAVRDRLARTLVPDSLVRKFEEVRQKLTESLSQLQGDVTSFDPTLAKALERSRAKMLYQLSKIEGKTEREAMRRDARANADALYLMHLIYPEKHLQERYYSILPFLAKHGLNLLDTLYENVHLDCPDHKVLVV